MKKEKKRGKKKRKGKKKGNADECLALEAHDASRQQCMPCRSCRRTVRAERRGTPSRRGTRRTVPGECAGEHTQDTRTARNGTIKWQ